VAAGVGTFMELDAPAASAPSATLPHVDTPAM